MIVVLFKVCYGVWSDAVRVLEIGDWYEPYFIIPPCIYVWVIFSYCRLDVRWYVPTSVCH